MGNLKNICVYCGSGLGADPLHAEAARVFGQAMAEAGVGLVYGGGSVGLMGTIARAVLDAGGAVTGIIPGFLKTRERPFGDLTELIVTQDMHARKMMMFERADAFVALPGGVGTLEELVEQMTWAQLGRHHKPVLLANIRGLLGSVDPPSRRHAAGEVHSCRPGSLGADRKAGGGYPADAAACREPAPGTGGDGRGRAAQPDVSYSAAERAGASDAFTSL